MGTTVTDTARYLARLVWKFIKLLVTTIFHSYNIENLFARISVLNELNVCGPTPIPPSKACMVPLSFQYPIVVWFL